MISYSTAADNSAPALNLATFFAGIVIVAFVEGLIPVLFSSFAYRESTKTNERYFIASFHSISN